MEATATFKTTLFLSYSEFVIASLQYAFLLTLETSNTMENNPEQRALELTLQIVKSEDTKKSDYVSKDSFQRIRYPEENENHESLVKF